MTLYILTRFYCPKCGTSWEQHTSQNQDAVLIERLHTLAELMRNTADYMLHCPDPAPQHAQELYGAAGVIGKWIDEVEDDGK